MSGTGESLWVVCAHPPHADPRIGWSADFARSHGYDVHVFGLDHRAEPTPSRPGETVIPAPGGRVGWARGLMHLHRLGLRLHPRDAGALGALFLILSPFLIVIGVPLLFIMIIVRSLRMAARLIRAVLRRMDVGLRALPKGEGVSNRLRHAGRVVRNRFWQPLIALLSPLSAQSVFRRALRQLTKGRLGEAWIALEGYRWYLLDHVLPLADALVAQARENPPQIIHAHDPDGLLAAVALKRACGARLVFDAHEYGPDAYLLRPRPRRLFRMIERAGVSHADAALGVSTPLINLWQARFPTVPFALLPNASPLAEIDFDPLPPPHQTQGREGRLSVLFQGGFAPERGVDRVIESWSSVRGADLYLRGPDGTRRDALLKTAHASGLLDKSIFFLPSLSEDELIAGAAFADIGLIPYASDVENHAIACPNKLGQFMMAGLMILSTDLPFVAEIITQGECGRIYDDRTIHDLSDTVNQLATDREFVNRKALNASRHARDAYHYEAYASALISSYRTPSRHTTKDH